MGGGYCTAVKTWLKMVRMSGLGWQADELRSTSKRLQAELEQVRCLFFEPPGTESFRPEHRQDISCVTAFRYI